MGSINAMHPKAGKVKKRASFDELLLAGVRAIAEKGLDQVSVTDVIVDPSWGSNGRRMREPGSRSTAKAELLIDGKLSSH